MTRFVQQLYERMPHSVRSVMGTGYGYYVRSWRYGRDFNRRVEEVAQRDTWSQAHWEAWRQGELLQLLERAAREVPFYRRYWSQQNRRDWRHLCNWPILEKETVRCEGRSLVADNCSVRSLFKEHTSGTTGTPLRLWSSRKCQRRWYAMFEARGRQWYGVSRQDRWAILGGKLIKPVTESRAPYWIWNQALNQLYMSCYHLSPARIPAYLDALKRYRIKYLYGYTSALYELAHEAIRQGRTDLRLKVAITNAESVDATQRKKIEEAFAAPVRETYGMAEMCGAASECECGSLHLWPDAGVLEVLEGDEPVRPGETGDFVFTGLVNHDMPLIRYRVGDRGSLSESAGCRCGRTLPVVRAIDGRRDDVLYTTTGERIGRLDPVFKEELPVRMAQVIQESPQNIRVLVVPDDGFTAFHAAEIARQLRTRLGDVFVTCEKVSDIPRTANGKFRAVICKLSPEERLRLNSSA